MVRLEPAFRARGIALIGISRDEPDASQSFARAYRIEYPLLSDATGAVSRAYTGVDDNDHTVPGVVIVRRDGVIVYRQVASTKDDRVSPTQILATADRVLGTSGVKPEPATPAIDRVQLRGDIGAAYTDRAAYTVASGIHVPIARYLVIGTDARIAIRGRFNTFSLYGGALGVRLPIFGDIAALQLTGMFGTSRLEALYVGGRFGVWFAWTPRMAVQLEAGLVSDDGSLAGFATFGVSYLVGR